MTSPEDELKDTNPTELVAASEASPRPRWPYIAGLVVALIAALALWQWGEPLLTLFVDQERVRAWLADFGPLAPLISIALNIIQVLVAPLPGTVIGFANGYLFGALWGTVYGVLGVTLGSATAMILGRRLGRPLVERFVDPKRLTRWDKLAVRRGPAFFFLVFLLPLLPDDIVCFVVGLSPLSIPYILALAAIGRLPGLIASSWIGASAGALSPLGLVILATGALVLAGMVLHYRDQLEAWMVRLADRMK